MGRLIRKRRAEPRPEVGQLVCDCWFEHQVITAINPDDGDRVTLADGLVCSFRRCCEPADHEPHVSPAWPQGWTPVCHYLATLDGWL